MFRIGEFSKLTQVSIRMLRYYDENGLLKPAESDPFTGYRLYGAEQIHTLNKIIFLRDVGFSVAEIAEAVNNWDNSYITRRLEDKVMYIQQEIEQRQNRLAKIRQAKKDILQDKIAIHYNVGVKSVPSYTVFSLRRVVKSYYDEGQLWQEMAAYAKKHTLPFTTDAFTIYHDTDYRETDLDIEVCTPIAKLQQDADGFTFRETQAVEHMAYTMVHGPFENIAGAFYSVAAWLSQHSQYRMQGPSRQLVHRGPWNEADSENYVTEIQIPLEKL